MPTGRLLERIAFLLLCLLAALLPFEAYQTVGRLAGLTPLKLIFVLMTVLLAAAAILLRERLQRPTPLVLAIALLCLAFTVSSLTATEFRSNALKSMLRYVVGLVLFLEVLFLTRRNSTERGRRLLTCLWIGSLASSILGYAILIGFSWADRMAKIFRPFEYYVYFNRRFSATLEYPNTAADYLVLTLPLVLMWASALKSGTRIVLALGLVVFPMLLGLPLTYSRGGMAACVLALLITGYLALRSRFNREALFLAGAALLILALYLPLYNWRLLLRDENPVAAGQPAINAAYQLSETRIQRNPDQIYETDIRVINTGVVPWKNTPKEPLVLACRWYEVDRKTSVWVDYIPTDLPAEVVPGQSVSLRARYRTPPQEGYYYLIWEIFQYRDRMPWSTGRRIVPGVAECFVSRKTLDLQSLPRTDPYQPEGGGEGTGSAASGPSRLRLWYAAIRIFQEHPWTGIGGGNFRLVYGHYLGMDSWDTRIQANSLVLEIAAGCGMLGLTALGLFAWSVAGCLLQKLKDLKADSAQAGGALQWGLIAAVIGFGSHNLIDYFMEFTPTYFAFWMILGLIASGPKTGVGES